MKIQEPIVVSGVGAISSLGMGSDHLWRNLIKGRDKIFEEEYSWRGQNVGSFAKHKVADFNCDNIQRDFSINLLNEAEAWRGEKFSIDFCALLKLIRLAANDSRLLLNGRSDIGLILTHENIEMEPLCWKILNVMYHRKSHTSRPAIQGLLKKFYKDFSKKFYESQQFMPLYHAAKFFDLHGFSLFINNACSSGLYAVDLAASLIRAKKCKAVIIAASDFQDIFKLMWLKDMGLYSRTGQTRPFHSDRDGFVSGEGGASIVVEELRSALKRKVPIYAEYLGGGFDQESWKVSLPKPGAESLTRAITQAFSSTKTSCSDIDLISLHGVGTRLNDAVEFKALENVFGLEMLKSTLSCAFKPYVGHLMGASSLMDLVLTVLSIQKQTVIPLLNYHNLDFELNFAKRITPKKIKKALKICSGFGGYNAAVIIGKHRSSL